jgi:hypothetical protein
MTQRVAEPVIGLGYIGPDPLPNPDCTDVTHVARDVIHWPVLQTAAASSTGANGC